MIFISDNINLISSEDGVLTIKLSGRLNSTAVADGSDELDDILSREEHQKVVLDCDDLDYISSMGLRKLLTLSKRENLQIVNVQPTVWEVFEMTGFTQIMNIRKAFREISIEGCEPIGTGANGTVYRLDAETIVKMYRENIPLEYIERERGYAQSAFLCGVPTAISYDVVRCGKRYGLVFELIDAVTFDRMLIDQPGQYEENIAKYVGLFKCMHASKDLAGKLPSFKDRYHEWIEDMRKDYIDEERRLMHQLVDAVPDADNLVNGDFHPRNVMFQNGNPIIIDMADIGIGSSLFDFACLGLTHYYYPTTSPSTVEFFVGLTAEKMIAIWYDVLERYFVKADKEQLKVIERTVLMMSKLRFALNPAIVLGLPRHFYESQVLAGKKFCAEEIKEAIELVAKWNTYE